MASYIPFFDTVQETFPDLTMKVIKAENRFPPSAVKRMHN